MSRTTDQGAVVWFYGPGAALTPPAGSWPAPVGEFMAYELRTGGQSGFVGRGYPFVLEIVLKD